MASAQFLQGVVAALGGAAPTWLSGGGVRDWRGQAVEGCGDDCAGLRVEVAAQEPSGAVLVQADRQAPFGVRGFLAFEEFLLVSCLCLQGRCTPRGDGRSG